MRNISGNHRDILGKKLEKSSENLWEKCGKICEKFLSKNHGNILKKEKFLAKINATILYRLNKDKDITRRASLRNLTRSLVMEHVQHRLTITQTPVEIKYQIPEVFVVDAPDRDEEYRPGWNNLCGTTRNRKTLTRCSLWTLYIGI